MTLLSKRWLWELLAALVILLIFLTQQHRLDRYRGMIAQEKVAAQLSALDHDAKQHAADAEQWKTRASEAEATAQTFARRLEQVQRRRPVLSAVARKVEGEAITDEGLDAEIRRVLPHMAYRLARDCR